MNPGLRTVIIAIAAGVALVAALPVAFAVILARVFVAACRRFEAVLARRSRLIWPKVTPVDAELGFRLSPGLDCDLSNYRGTDPYRLQTCAEGWPGTQKLEACDVIVVGDSFAAGAGVDSTHTYYAPRREGPLIKPLACSGYSMVQGLQLIRRLSSRQLEGRLVVWLICIGNDLADNWSPGNSGRRVPFMRSTAAGDKWEVAMDHIAAATTDQPWTASLGRARNIKSRVSGVVDYYRDCYASRRGYAIARELIRDAAAHIDKRGGRLIVFATPYQPIYRSQLSLERTLERIGVSARDWQRNGADAKLGSICESLGIAYQSGLELMQSGDFLSEGEDHWNERGHRRFRDWLNREHATHTQSSATSRQAPAYMPARRR